MSSGVSFCITDHKSNIVSCSLEFSEVTGYPLNEILGRNCNFLQGERTDPETVANIRKNIAERRVGEHVIANYTKSGTFFWNYFRIVPVRASAAPTVKRPYGLDEELAQLDAAVPREEPGLRPKQAEAFMEQHRAQEREKRLAEDAEERARWEAEGGDPVVYFVGFQKAVGNDPAQIPDIDGLNQDDVLPYERLWIERLKPGVNTGLDVETGSMVSSKDYDPSDPTVDKFVTYAGRDVLVVGLKGSSSKATAEGSASKQDLPALADVANFDDGTAAALVASQLYQGEAVTGASIASSLPIDIMKVEPRLVLGVSSCLLGQRVRYNSQGMRNDFVVDTLGAYVSKYVPVCPEVGIGLPVPRPTLRLVKDANNLDRPRLMCPTNGNDYTDQMEEFANSECDRLAKEHISGFIFKASSPSSGVYGVKVYNEVRIGSSGEKTGTGAFTRVFRQRFPFIPVEEEGRLQDLGLRENFLSRIFAFARLRTVAALKPTFEGLSEFHAHMRLAIMLHSPVDLVELDRFLAAERLLWKQGESDFTTLLHAYAARLMLTMSRIVSVDSHVRVMTVVCDTMAAELTPRDLTELKDVMNDYADGYLPWIVPITLLRHHVNGGRAPNWLRIQLYLQPNPREMMLGTHAIGPSSRSEIVRERRNAPGNIPKGTTSCDSCTSGACGSHVKDMSW